MTAGRIVFAGGGHAHLYSLKRTGELVERGFEVVLVNPGRFLYYSGMSPGLLSGTYSPDEARIDVRHLVESGGGEFIEGRVRDIRPDRNLLVLEDGREVAYDALSVCFGSGVPGRRLSAGGDRVTPVKPVENMVALNRELRSLGGRLRVLVAGGGPAGCEVACNVSKIFEGAGIEGEVLLVDANPTVLKDSPARARRLMGETLKKRGVRVGAGRRIERVEEGVALTSEGEEISFDRMILAVGIAPPDICRRSGLLTSEDGGLWTNANLQSVSDHSVFGGGDSVAFRGDPLPRLGVFAIRQGPVIFHNLQALLTGRPLRPFTPQKNFLYILNLGGGEGLAVRGGLAWRGRAAWRLKDHIDRRFMSDYRRPNTGR